MYYLFMLIDVHVGFHARTPRRGTPSRSVRVCDARQRLRTVETTPGNKFTIKHDQLVTILLVSHYNTHLVSCPVMREHGGGELEFGIGRALLGPLEELGTP